MIKSKNKYLKIVEYMRLYPNYKFIISIQKLSNKNKY